MDHLGQENRELKEEVARLTALMESFMAAQSQSSPTPSTPSQRTVTSEIISSNNIWKYFLHQRSIVLVTKYDTREKENEHPMDL
jgi:hypothetical protein